MLWVANVVSISERSQQHVDARHTSLGALTSPPLLHISQPALKKHFSARVTSHDFGNSLAYVSVANVAGAHTDEQNTSQLGLPSQFFKERLAMTNRYGLAAILSAAALLCGAALILGPKVNAAAEGKITGTVKFVGTAPHMRGIDMSKDDFCANANANDPVHLETVVVGQGGGLENVVVPEKKGR